MSYVLVVEPEPRSAERIEQALGSQGWEIKVVDDPSEALRAAAAQAPKLVIVDGESSAGRELIRFFARRRGGPGALVLLPRESAAAELGADETLVEPFTPQDLQVAVQRCLSATRETPPEGPAEAGERLSSREIFGDVLAELETTPPDAASPGEGPAPAPPDEPAEGAPGRRRPVTDEELSKRLDETLSGLVEKTTPKAKREAPKAARPASEVDALLDKTLADLKIGPRRGRRRGAAEPPEEGAAPARPAAGAEPPAGEPAGRDFGQYTLEERIAVGGMAEVWKARMKGFEGFQKTVAIKKILPHLTASEDFVTMFIDEAKLAAQLNHNNIIQIYDLGKVGDDYYIAMEHVEGKDLRAVLRQARRRGRRLPLGQTLLVAARLADALHYAHNKRDFDDRELGLVHRDVSPQNVLISTEGEIKLCDFGIAKAVSKVGETRMGALKGKIRYMSPEQAWGRPVDARSDIFSLGVLLFEMLTGQPLFAGESEVSVLDAVRECKVPDPRQIEPEIPQAVAAVLARALHAEPEERYQSAAALQDDLADILLGLEQTPSRIELARFVEELFAASAPARPAPAAPVAPPESPPEERRGAGEGEEEAPAEEAEEAAAEAGERAGEAPPRSEPDEEPRPASGTVVTPAVEQPSAEQPAGEPTRTAPGLEVEALEPVDEAEVEEESTGGRRAVLLAALVAAAVVVVVGLVMFGPLGGPGDGGEAGGEPVGRVPAVTPDGAGGDAGQDGELPAAPAAGEAAAGEPVTGENDTGVGLGDGGREGAGAEAAGGAPTAPEPGTEPAPPPARPRVEATPADAGAPEPTPPPREARTEPEPAVVPEPAGEAATTAPPPGEDAGAGITEPEPTEGAGASEAGAEAPATPPPPVAEPAAEPAIEPAIEPAVEPAAAPDEGERGEEAAERQAAAPPAETSVQEGDLVEAGPGVVPPELVTFTKPQYPPMARKLKVEGTVIVSILVDENGMPAEWRLVKSVSPKVGIDDAVLSAVESARFRPATKDGVRVKMWYNLVVPFKL